ncbi:MAG: DedA family protein [Chitinivibrionales bacterium]|nr:DedA family protein [Chitinivibrionales bacterium]
MHILTFIIDFIIHLDKHLAILISTYGVWTYLILFLIIYCETGLVVTPFLPGDSLIFAAGAFAATGSFNVWILFLLLSIAAIFGNTTNYWIGYYIGPGILKKDKIKFINKKYLDRAHKFYEKYGGMTIVFARFIPIVRTFAPFVAGIGFMNQWRFTFFNVAAGIVWVGLFTFAGYFFGNIPVVKHNFTLVIFAIIIVSILPPFVEYFRQRLKKK